MTFILLKKQFLEVNRSLFQKRKTGELRSKGNVVGMFILFALVLIACFAMFFGVSISLAATLLGNGNDWLYFALQGMIAVLFGTFGSVFNTYTQLYKANDNELLISMPIPARCILLSKMLVVMAMSLLYSGLIWIPTIVAFCVVGQPTVLAVIFSIINIFVIALFVSACTCGMGFLVALASKRMANKSIAVTVMSVVFFIIYYYVCFNLNSLLEKLVANSEAIGEGIAAYIWPLYQLGLASVGEVLPMVLNTLLCGAVFSLCYFILSKTFLSINLAPDVVKKVEYKSRVVKSKKSGEALIGRELKRFLNSTTYMLNSGLGLGFMPVLAVLAFIKREDITLYINLVGESLPPVLEMVPLLVAGFLMIMISLNVISAASVSLEGKNIWIVQSLPIDAQDVLRAKEQFHIRMNLIPALFACVLLSISFKVEWNQVIVIIALVTVFICFCADTGLMFNLKMPNLNWTNESAPVKSGLPVAISLFGGWIFALLSCGLYFPFSLLISVDQYMYILLVFFGLLVFLERKWIYSKGAIIFKNL